MLILRDLNEVLSSLDNTDFALGAVPAGRKKYYKTYLNFNDDVIKYIRLEPAPFLMPSIRHNFEQDEPAFNAGVLVIDFDRWRLQNITQQLEHWMKLVNDNAAAFTLTLASIVKEIYGNLVPSHLFLLYFIRNIFRWIQGICNKLTTLYPPILNQHRYHVGGLGYGKPAAKPHEIEPAFILHWNGPKKPWFKNRYSEFFHFSE